MKTETKALENNLIEVQVECTPEQVDGALDQAYRKVVRSVTVPGFRKGKVPRQILEMRYGVEVLYDDAIEALLPEAYEAAMAAVEVTPIDRPEMEVVEFNRGEPAIFKFLVQGPPIVDAGEYLGVEVEEVKLPFSQEEVEAQLSGLQKEHARLVESPEEAVVEGDFVILSYEGFVNDVAFEGGQADNHTLEIGSNSFIPGFETGLIGLRKDEKAAIDVTFPEEYHNEDLAGQPAVFKVEIKDIKRKVFPELDDDFASEVSEFASLEELRQDIENKLQESKLLEEKRQLQARVLKAVVQGAQVDIPQVMVEQESEAMVDDFVRNLVGQGLPEKFVLDYVEEKLETLKEEYQDMAREKVKTFLVLDKIKEEEAITASEEELEERIAKMAADYNQEAAEMREQLMAQGSLELLRDAIVRDKTVDLLVEAAVLVPAKEEIVAEAEPEVDAEPEVVPEAEETAQQEKE